MAIVKLEHLEPGMVLDHDVKDLSGRMLLRAGSEISAKHLKIFRSWGVSEAHIRGVGDDAASDDFSLDQLDPDMLARLETTLRDAFVHNDLEEPVVRELFDQALLYRAGVEARRR